MNHKYLFSFLILLFGSVTLFSQDYFDRVEYYIGTGYNLSWGKFDNFNSILNRYNETNTQEKEFKELHIPNGFAFAVGANLSVFSFEGGFSQRQQRSKTKFALNEALRQRDVRLRMNTYYIRTGVIFPSADRFAIGAGVSGNYNNIRYSTREGDEKSMNRVSFISPVIEKRYGMTVDLNFYFGAMNDHSTKLILRPFYGFVFKTVNAAPLDELLNGDTSGGLSDPFSQFGLSFIVIYSVVK